MSPTENVPFEIEGWCGVRMEWGVGCGWGEGTTVLTLTPTPHSLKKIRILENPNPCGNPKRFSEGFSTA